MRGIPWQAAHQFDVFTARQAYESGWSATALERAAAGSELIRLRRGVYALPPDPELDKFATSARLLGQKGVAAALQIPDGSVSHAAALAVRRLPLYRASDIPCLTKPQDCRTLQHEIHLHRRLLTPKLLDPHLDFSITSVARSCVDVACELGLNAGVIAADAALNRGLVTEEELLIARCSVKGDVGSPIAGQMLDLVDPKAESPLESLSRVRMHGLVPRPLTQRVLRTPDGRFIARVDFYWEEFGVVGEADGKFKYEEFKETLPNQAKRQEALTNSGLTMARWGWSLAERPQQLADYLYTRFEESLMLRAAGIYPRVVVCER